jgi:hypothetical protein
MSIPLRFSGDQVAHYIENDVQTVAFAEGKSPEPSKYVILQRAIPHEGENYYYEIGSREVSGEGGLNSFEVSSSGISIILSGPLRMKANISSIEINLTDEVNNDAALRAALENIFSASDCLLKFS